MFSKTSIAVAVTAIAITATGSATAASLITGRQIKNHTITTKDISKSTVRSLRGHDGLDGLDGDQGPQGVQGPAGVNGGANTTPVEADYSIAPGDIEIYDATCPAGMRAVSGGWFTSSADGAFVDQSYDGTSWSVGADNFDGSIAASVHVIAYCATGTGVRKAVDSSADRHAAVAAVRASHK